MTDITNCNDKDGW